MKIKILRVDYHHCDDSEYLQPVTTDWEEIDDSEYTKYSNAVREANLMLKSGEAPFVLVSYSEDTTAEMFEKASKWKEKIVRQQKAEEKRKADAKAKREATALKRKQKQLEKLKKELGEE